MLKLIKFLGILILTILLAVLLFFSFIFYQAYRSGDIKSYFMKYLSGAVVDKSKLSPTQVEYLEKGDYENLVKDIGENITPEQVDCATAAVGKERALELMNNKDPTPEEILKLSKCL